MEGNGMTKGSKTLLPALCCICFFCIPVACWGAEIPMLRIGGLVQAPLHLSLSDLQRLRGEILPVYAETGRKEEAIGKFNAVALRNLIGLAKTQGGIESLALSIKNSHGEQMVLSGGEVLTKARDGYFVAESVTGGSSAAAGRLPALIIEKNRRFYLALRQISFIEVISVAQLPSNLDDSRKITLPDSIKGRLVKTASIAGYRLQSVLDQIALKPGATEILKFTAKDGSAITVSAQELENDPGPLVVPRDTRYDLRFREGERKGLEGIESVEIINLKQKPMMYVVGVGCGDPNLLTGNAISIMAKADVLVSKQDYLETFAGYIAGKPVLFDPFMQLARFQKAQHPEITDEEAEKRADQVYADNIRMLKAALADGKIIALLEPGDPTLYGGWRNWLSGHIPQNQIQVIAGMSSFSVANAVLGEHDISKNAIIIAEPEQLISNEPLVQTAAEKGNVLVLFMGLSRMKSLLPLLGKYFPADTPVHIVYYAGIAGKERRMRTSLSEVLQRTESEKENFLGLVYIGRELKSPGSER